MGVTGNLSVGGGEGWHAGKLPCGQGGGGGMVRDRGKVPRGRCLLRDTDLTPPVSFHCPLLAKPIMVPWDKEEPFLGLK